jgi:hypothetical protein
MLYFLLMSEQSKSNPNQVNTDEAKKGQKFSKNEFNLSKSAKLEESKIAPGLYRPIPEEALLTWEAPARPFKKRNKQFFSTVLIIAILIALILFFAGQVLPVALVISVVFLVYVTAMIPPHNIAVKLTNYGIYIDKEAFSWQEMGRFWFEKKQGFDTLQIELARFPNRLSLVLIKGETPNKEDLKLVLSEVLLEEKPKPTTFEKVSLWLSEKIPLE